MATFRKKLLWKHHHRKLPGLPETAKMIWDELKTVQPFVLWLEGPVGSGKTSLVGVLLKCAGLPSHVPVTSPTFSYFNEYEIGDGRFFHCDFYRGGEKLKWEEIGITWPDRGGFFVEWPLEGHMQADLAPTHLLNILYNVDGSEDSRTYEFFKIEDY